MPLRRNLVSGLLSDWISIDWSAWSVDGANWLRIVIDKVVIVVIFFVICVVIVVIGIPFRLNYYGPLGSLRPLWFSALVIRSSLWVSSYWLSQGLLIIVFHRECGCCLPSWPAY